MLKGAKVYGVMDEVLDSASEVMSRADFKETVSKWLSSTAIHARRRAKEMNEAIEALEALSIKPIMCLGTKELFDEIAALGLNEAFQGQIPKSFHSVLGHIESRKKPDKAE
jgi:hypothetical protein